MTSEHEPPAADLELVIEQLAARVHEEWVEHRVRQGWRLGERRDEEARLSPLLVPYEQLTQAEREIDRVTVRRTLAGLEELGFRVEANTSPRIEPSREQVLTQADRLIGRGQPLPAYDLTKRWLAEHPDDGQFLLLNARALRRCGALHRALQVLDTLADGPDADGERRGLLAAVH